MKTAMYSIAVLFAVLLAGFGPAQEKPKPVPAEQPKKPSVMQRKLAHAQKLLEGLAINDFAKIESNANELMLCSKEASWMVLKTPKYEIFSNDFQREMDALKAAAKKKNVDAAALAYVDMTLTCVKCHQYVREEGIGAAPDLSPRSLRGAATE